MENVDLANGARDDELQQDEEQEEGQQQQGELAETDGAPLKPRPEPTPLPASLQNPPSLRTVSDTSTMTPSSTPLGHLNAARRPAVRPSVSSSSAGGMTQDIRDKMKAFSLSRQGAPPSNPISPASSNTLSPSTPSSASPQPPLAGGLSPATGHLPTGHMAPQTRPSPQNWASSPSIPRAQGSVTPKMGGGLAAKRGINVKLSDAVSPGSSNSSEQQSPNSPGRRGSFGEKNGAAPDQKDTSAFSKYSELVDTKTGTLHFKNQAVIHGGGIDFTSGRSFSISLDHVETLDELGKGNYGVVYKVRHSAPRPKRRARGLSDVSSRQNSQVSDGTPAGEGKEKVKLSNVIMAMKEIRLQLDDAKFTAIIMELDILHRCVSPFVIDFYGAFFQEGAVYICVEYMDGGSMEKLYGDGVPENILRKIALSTIMGLRTLKDDHNIIHRDVKPTNILVNTRGQIKICDFGVSGNLVASIAKTNIGCQSYMAPERIAGGTHSGNSAGGTYSVQSDVWSLGLAIVECARGGYPYPPDTYNNIFSQLNAIVHGDPPELPETGFCDDAKHFVKSCLNKTPAMRPSYAKLIRHPWLASLMEPPSSEEDAQASESEPVFGGTADYPTSPPEEVIDKEVADWVRERLDRRMNGDPSKARPALHAVALDAVPGSPLLDDPASLSPR